MEQEQKWMEEGKLTFKLCSLFLQYPDWEWISSEGIGQVNNYSKSNISDHNPESLISAELLQSIQFIENRGIRYCFEQFLSYVISTPYKLLTENYVRWFDFSERTTLYLTHERFGDNRERGLAFVKLKMEFAKAGFYIKNDELPDFLPLILEFAALADEKSVQKMFLIHKKAIDSLLTELEKDDNPYGFLLKACVTAMATYLPVRNGKWEHHAG